MTERVMDICDVCGSDFGNGAEAEECLRVHLPHCASLCGLICVPCATEIGRAAEEDGLL